MRLRSGPGHLARNSWSSGESPASSGRANNDLKIPTPTQRAMPQENFSPKAASPRARAPLRGGPPPAPSGTATILLSSEMLCSWSWVCHVRLSQENLRSRHSGGNRPGRCSRRLTGTGARARPGRLDFTATAAAARRTAAMRASVICSSPRRTSAPLMDYSEAGARRLHTSPWSEQV